MDLQVALEESVPPKRNARIATLVEEECSKQAALRSPTPSSEDESDDELCWPEGGWLYLQVLPGPSIASPHASP
jgi:hypothetical protein